jgi:hypothetical protein
MFDTELTAEGCCCASRADAITKLVIVAVINPSHTPNCRVIQPLEARATYHD